MVEIDDSPVCPQCGFNQNEPRSPHLLPYRTVLNKKFVIGRVLGKPGGFGVTYLGWDLVLHTKVAIKEYFPRDLASRGTNCVTLVPYSQDDMQSFRFGQEQFLQEARTLAKFKHPNVVRVVDFFEENSTAYLVMDYYEGLSLSDFLTRRRGGKPTEKLAFSVMSPILDGLKEVHQLGFLHRDIKPPNIYITKEKKVILLDFGAARLAMGQKTKSLSVVLTPGFAPYEQYQSRGNQGPWTDIYACGATVYYIMTDTAPPDSIERFQKDDLIPIEKLNPSISGQFRDAVTWALAVHPQDRPQSVEQFQARFNDSTSLKRSSPLETQSSQTATKTQASPLVRINDTQGTQPIGPNKSKGGVKYCPHCGSKNFVASSASLHKVKCVKCREPLTGKAEKSYSRFLAFGLGVALAVGLIVSFISFISYYYAPLPPDVQNTIQQSAKPGVQPSAQNVDSALQPEQAAETDDMNKLIEMQTPEETTTTRKPQSQKPPRGQAASVTEAPEQPPSPEETRPPGESPIDEPMELQQDLPHHLQAPFMACQGKSDGDECSFETPIGYKNGRCKLNQHNDTVCYPDYLQPGELPEEPEHKPLPKKKRKNN
jgi:serine/threonine protein kinase